MIIDEIPANAKPVSGYPMYYVSPDGYVISTWLKKPFVMSPGNNGAGYLYVFLRDGKGGRKRKYLHHIVAEEFVDKPEGTSQINHRDGDKANNAASNLEWVTPKENIAHAIRTGLWNQYCGIPGKKVRVIDRYTGEIVIYPSLNECAKQIDYDRGNLWHSIQRHGIICNGRYCVEYVEPETLNNDRTKGFTTLEEYIDIPKY